MSYSSGYGGGYVYGGAAGTSGSAGVTQSSPAVRAKKVPARTPATGSNTSGSGEYVITSSAARELLANAPRLRERSSRTAIALAGLIDALLPAHAQLLCSWSDGGAMIAEWINDGARFGFSFDLEQCPTWFHVDLGAGIADFGPLSDGRFLSEMIGFFRGSR